MSARPSLEDFVQLRGTQFRMLAADATQDVELIETRDLGSHRIAGKDVPCFALTFRSGPGPTWPQATYRLEHPTLGPLDVFLVPLGPDERGMRYEAIFG